MGLGKGEDIVRVGLSTPLPKRKGSFMEVLLKYVKYLEDYIIYHSNYNNRKELYQDFLIDSYLNGDTEGS